MAAATEPSRCPDCGYGKEHDPACPQLEPNTEDVPEVERADTEATDPKACPDPSLGLRYHGNPGPLFAALAQAQQAYDGLEKNGYNAHKDYRYAKLEDLLEATMPALNDNGLTFTQFVVDGTTGQGQLITILGHETGALLESRVSLPSVKLHGDSSGGVQAMGSAITYMRRYTAQSMLGVAGETDDDGAAAQQAADTPATSQASGNDQATLVVTNGLELGDDGRQELKNLGMRFDPNAGVWTVQVGQSAVENYETKLQTLGADYEVEDGDA